MAKSFFRLFMALGTYLYKISNGKIGGRISGLQVLLLTTTGRKTGKKRTTPLGYFKDQEGGYVIIGSNAGFDTHPAWFHNLTSQPHVTIQIKDKELEVNTVGQVSAVLRRLRKEDKSPNSNCDITSGACIASNRRCVFQTEINQKHVIF